MYAIYITIQTQSHIISQYVMFYFIIYVIIDDIIDDIIKLYTIYDIIYILKSLYMM